MNRSLVTIISAICATLAWAKPETPTGSGSSFGVVPTAWIEEVYGESASGGYAVRFDGFNDVMTIAFPPVLGNTFTHEFWMLPTSSTVTFRGIIGGTAESPALRPPCVYQYGKKLHFGFGDGTTWHSTLTTNDVLELHAWNHVAVAFDGTNYLAYVNGTLVQTYAVPSGAAPVQTPQNRVGGLDNYFQGTLDEVRVWNTARTEAEIKANMFRYLSGNETGMAAYFQLYEGTDVEVFNLVDRAARGTLTNGPVWMTSASFAGPRNAIRLDGTADKDIRLASTLNLTNNYSIETWFNSTNSTSENTLFTGMQESLTGNPGVSLNVSATNITFAQRQPAASSGGIQLDAPGSFLDGRWHHLAAVKSETNLLLYVDGVLLASTSGATNLTFDLHAMIGRRTSTDNSCNFKGRLDEFRLWNIARTEADIRECMTRNLAGSESGLVGYYRFDELDGTTAYDSSPNANHAALTGMNMTTHGIASDAYNTWIGSEDSDWDDHRNWSRRRVPSETESLGLYWWNTLSSAARLDGYPTFNNMIVSADSADALFFTSFQASGNSIFRIDAMLSGETHSQGPGYLIVEPGFALTLPIGGSLFINGTAMGSFNIQDGTTFGGEGTIIGDVTTASGSFVVLSPGASASTAGTLTIDGTLNVNGYLDYYYKRTAQTSSKVDVSGSIAFDPSFDFYIDIIDLGNADFTPETPILSWGEVNEIPPTSFWDGSDPLLQFHSYTNNHALYVYEPSASPDNGPFDGGNSVVVLSHYGEVTAVLVDSVPAQITGTTAGTVTIIMPFLNSAGAKDIIIQTLENGDIILTSAYTYNFPGMIAENGVSPNTGFWQGGYSVSIVGSYLTNGEQDDITSVTLCGIEAASIDYTSPTQIVITAGTANESSFGIGDVKIVSSAYGETDAANAFTYTFSNLLMLGSDGMSMASGNSPSPTSGTAFPQIATGSELVSTLAITNNGTQTLSISGFGISNPEFTVSGLPSTVAVGASESFTITFSPHPTGQHFAELVITNDSPLGAYSVNMSGFSYDISQYGGPYIGGNSLTIYGVFGNVTNITVGGISATITGTTGDSTTITLPQQTIPGEKQIVMQTSDNGDLLLDVSYTYYPAGTIDEDGVSPSSGSWQGGYTATISGANLSNGEAGDVTSVTLAGIDAQITSISSTQIVVTAGEAAAAGSGDVIVTSTSHGVTTKLNAFEYLKTAQSISFPTLAPTPSGSTLTLSATATSGLEVEFSVLQGPGTLDGTTLTLTEPGDVQLVASQAGNAVWFDAPNVTNLVKSFSMSGVIGPYAGGNSITITNGNFGSITNVLVGGIAATIVESTSASFTIILPATESAGVTDLVVQTSDKGDITLAGAYTYYPAGTIDEDGISPSSGSWQGGYTATITGANLSNGEAGDVTSVTLAGVDALITSISSTQIVVTAGEAAAAGSGDVVVTSTSHGVTIAVDAFVYTAGLLIGATGAFEGTPDSEIRFDWNVGPIRAGAWRESFDESLPGWLSSSGINAIATQFPSMEGAPFPARTNAWFGNNVAVLSLHTSLSVATNTLAYASVEGGGAVSTLTRPVYFDLRTRFEPSLPTDIQDAWIFGLHMNTDNKLVAIDGKGTVVDDEIFDTENWHQVTFVIGNGTYSILVDGIPKFTDLVIRGGGSTLGGLVLYGIGWVDEMYVSHCNPDYVTAGPTIEIPSLPEASGEDLPTEEQQTRINVWLQSLVEQEVVSSETLLNMTRQELAVQYLLNEIGYDGVSTATPVSYEFSIGDFTLLSATQIDIESLLITDHGIKQGLVNGRIRLQGKTNLDDDWVDISGAVTPTLPSFTNGISPYNFTIPADSYRFFRIKLTDAQ